MTKLFAFALIGFCAPLFVTAANLCDATNLDVFEHGVPRDYVNSLTTCDNYLSKIYKRLNLGKVRLNVPTSCFTVRITGDGPLNDFKVKGCMPQDMCSSASEQVMAEIRKQGLERFVRTHSCRECSDDNCNKSH